MMNDYKKDHAEGGTSSPLLLSTWRSVGTTKVKDVQPLWTAPSDMRSSWDTWGTSKDRCGLRDGGAWITLLSSIAFRIADLSTCFSTRGTTSSGSTLQTSIMIWVKALSSMSFWRDNNSSCLASTSSKSLDMRMFYRVRSSKHPFKALTSSTSFSSRDRLSLSSPLNFSTSTCAAEVLLKSRTLWLM